MLRLSKLTDMQTYWEMLMANYFMCKLEHYLSYAKASSQSI